MSDFQQIPSETFGGCCANSSKNDHFLRWYSWIDTSRNEIEKKDVLICFQQGVCQTVALPFTLIKKYLKPKEELRKLKYFTMQKYNLQKKILKKNPKSFKIL